MTKITLDEFCAHWVTGNYFHQKGNKLYYNAQDFATAVGEYSKQQFCSSFEKGGFCSERKWEPRTSRWGKKFTHPTMIDTGTLSKSIKGEKSSTNIGKLRGRGPYRRSACYNIYTTEVSSAVKGKRGRKRGKYKNYAAVHNTDPKFGLYTVNQYSSRRPLHRQFIGFSPKIDDYVNAHLIDMLFEGFPK